HGGGPLPALPPPRAMTQETPPGASRAGRRAVGRNRPAEARWSTLDQLLSLQARSQADLMARTE
ncbi:MAG: hypothetical protein O3A18_00960, partial [Planctomycetota bacterium]|nr:hypothetical protein [Planctomycetota bacterium]